MKFAFIIGKAIEKGEQGVSPNAVAFVVVLIPGTSLILARAQMPIKREAIGG